MKHSSGLQYFYEDFLRLDQSAILFCSDFLSGSNFPNYLEKSSWVTGVTFPGKLNNPPSNFYSVSGQGIFNGSNNVEIIGSFPKSDFSFLISCQKDLSKNSIILSSSAGSNFSSYSGLTLGINDANYLYLDYWNPVEGRICKTLLEQIGSKNMLFLKKSSSNFEFGFVDTSLDAVFYGSVDAQDERYAHSDKFYLGKSNSTFSTGNNLVGYFDAAYAFSGLEISSQEFDLLSSGFYVWPESGVFTGVYQDCVSGTILSGSGVVLGTGITGYEEVTTYITGYVPTGYHQSGYVYYDGYGITGYERVYMGTTTDDCGYVVENWKNVALYGDIYRSGTTGVYSGYQEVVTEEYYRVPLSGEITGTINVYVPFEDCSGVSGYSSGGMYYDLDFLKTFGFESVYSLYPCSSDNCIKECFLNTGQSCDSELINVFGSYDFVSGGFKIKPDFAAQDKNLFYSNGQLLYENGWSSYPSGYSTIYEVSGNIFLDGSLIRSQGGNYLDSQDSLFYDHSDSLQIEKAKIVSGLPAGSPISSVFSSVADCFVFLNGQKLIRGVDFNSSNFIVEIPPNSVVIKVNDDYLCGNYSHLTGYQNRFDSNGEKFDRGSSVLYINGLRQEIGRHYLEVSKHSILSGCVLNNLQDTKQVIFKGIENYWNF